jgi:hypothetical protein
MEALNLKITPQRWQVCAMCHASGECPECPERCRKEGRGCLQNGCQTCTMALINSGVLTFEGQADRLEAWLQLVKDIPSMRKLKKYFVKQ